jgi:hypothetical protein
MSKFYEKLKVHGYLRIRVLDGITGREIRRIEKPNLVCVGAKTAMAKLLAPSSEDDQDFNQLWSIGAGDDNTAPTVADTDLKGTKTFRKVCDSRDANAGGVQGLVEVQTTFAVGEGNVLSAGEYFEECALFSRGDSDTLPSGGTGGMTTDSLMYARQLHAPIHKDNTIALEYTWRFQITTS